MNSNIADVELTGEALTYLRSCLSDGKVLSGLLDSAIASGGRTHAFLPRTFVVTPTTNFEAGGVIKRGHFQLIGDTGMSAERIERSDIDVALIDFISQFLSSSGDRLVILAHPYARPTDRWLMRTQAPYAVHEDEVYFLILASNFSSSLIADALASWRGSRAIGALTRDETHRTRPGAQLDMETLRKLASNTEHILSCPFDGESEIIWSKHSLG